MNRVYIETERQDLFDVSIVIAMRFHISGNVTEQALRNAFERAVESHEILSTKVVIDAEGKAFYEKLEKENSVNDLADSDNTSSNKIFFEVNDWQSIIHREEKKRFKIEEGEFIRGFVYESGSEESGEGVSILFMMHHLGGDGKSLVYFIETFMNYLVDDGSKLLNSDRSDKDGLDNSDVRVLEMRTIPAGDISEKALRDRVGPLALVPKIYNKKWLKEMDSKEEAGKNEKRIFTFSDLDEAYDEYWKDRESEIKEYVIAPETMTKVLEKCKEWKIGFTAYFTTAFLRRMARKLDIGYAVDAREDGNKSMGNQATGISIKYAYNYDKSFRKNAEKVQDLMSNKLEDDGARNFILPFMAAFEPTLVDAINLEHAGAFRSKTSKSLANMLGYGRKTKDLSITNLTKLDIPDTYGSLKIDYFSFIPPVVSYGRNIIGLSTLGDCTVLTIHRIK